jgi:hypothetical protein
MGMSVYNKGKVPPDEQGRGAAHRVVMPRTFLLLPMSSNFSLMGAEGEVTSP